MHRRLVEGATVTGSFAFHAAILSRTWQPLDGYAEALEACGIPTAHAGGGNLLETQAAKDACSLLRFLADPRDDLALVAVLRSPWFAVSDRILFKFVEENPQRSCWWDILRKKTFSVLSRECELLEKLLEIRVFETPYRLLQASRVLRSSNTDAVSNTQRSDKLFRSALIFAVVTASPELSIPVTVSAPKCPACTENPPV